MGPLSRARKQGDTVRHRGTSQKHAVDLFTSLYLSSPIGIYIVQDRKFQLVNPEFQKSTGYSEEELLGMESLSLVISEQRRMVKDRAVKMLKGERSAPYEFKVRSKSGEVKWIMETVASIQYNGRKAALGNFMDITRRKRTEIALKQREELYRSVVEQTGEAIYLVDARTKHIIEANPAFRMLLGFNLNDMGGLTLYDYIAHERENVDHNIERILEQGGHFLGERRHRRKDGSLVEMEVSANAITYSGRRAICAVARDISDRKRAEQENRFLTQRLMTVAEEERKKLARDLHDELGQSLTALHFCLDALQNSLPERLIDQRRKCAESVGLVEQIGDTVRNILFELRPSILDDLGLVPTLEWYTGHFENRGLGFKINFQSLGLQKRLNPDIEIVLFRAFQECFNNIVKHARAKNVDISITYSHPKVIFRVKDDGVGFNPGRRAWSHETNRVGIGLLGMRERVASVGGTFEVRSRPGKGTVVRAVIPDLGRQENA